MSREAKIKVFKSKISNAQRVLANFEKFLSDYVPERDFPVLEIREKDVASERESFDKFISEVELLEDDSDYGNIRTQFDESYFSCYSKAFLIKKAANASATLVRQNETDSLLSRNNSNLEDLVIESGSGSVAQSHRGKLPLLNIPSFSGSYDTWLGFHDLFKSLVDDNKSITDIEKLYHLKGCLKGDAAEVLASIELSAENYSVAWELLKERYDNRKIIREGHAKSLLHLPCVSKEFPVRSLLDQVQKHIRALKALKQPVDTWDTLLIVIIKEKLNPFLREKWEDSSNELPQPTYNDIVAFLQKRAQFEDTKSYQQAPTVKNQNSFSHSRQNQRSQHAYMASTTKVVCSYCQGDHFVSYCEKFKNLSPQGRFEAAKKASLCLNCLRSNHRVYDCSSSPCRKCNKKHNTLLHFEKLSSIESISSEPAAQTSTLSKSVTCSHASVTSEGLLATAIVDLFNSQGKSKSCRVFLDSGSQANFITEDTASFLNLRKKPVDISVTGVEYTSTDVKHSVSATMKSRFSKFQKDLDFFVLPRITAKMPSLVIKRNALEIPKNITLADPEFHKPSDIEILIGVKLFYKLLCIGQIELKNHPDVVLQKTQLGWIVAGEISSPLPSSKVQCHLATHSTPLESSLTKFWEVEEIPSSKILSVEEKACEAHFAKNTQRNSDGRYVVKLPFNENKSKLGDSFPNSSRRFKYLESRFVKNPELKQEYFKFLNEYEALNHMSLLKNSTSADPGFFLPHHAVIKSNSLTTKIRVVFDGSTKTSSGISLNDSLMVGPTIQDDLFSLLTRFRTHKYALTADIEKMYRQVLVHTDDTIYQKILFRENENDPVKIYSLNTVTYGTSCASFLAIRALHQLADDEGADHPIAAAVLKRDFYVDDLLTGTNTRHEATFLRNDLSKLLEKGGFPLRKWASNDPTLVSDVSVNPSDAHMSLDPNSNIKTLGIQWNPGKDFIFYSVNLSEFSKQVTKRSILSQVAKLFDPLGLLGPVIVKAKIIIQLLWKAGVSWDGSIPLNIHTMWTEYKEQLPLLSNVRFNRLMLAPDYCEIEMHGFSDASEKAYGACIYLRSTDPQGRHHSFLVCSKSRVAPVSSGTMTLPRLELCAALLLSHLVTVSKKALQIDFKKIVLWSDSTITLQWIKTEPHTQPTFIANRIAEIQKLTSSCEWRHVPSQENSADLVSRGQMPQEFIESQIWKNGPHWLSQEETHWPAKVHVDKAPPKRSFIVAPIQVKMALERKNLLEKYSLMNKLQRHIAYLLRFIHNSKNKTNKYIGPLAEAELSASNRCIIQLTQSAEFSKEISYLKNGEKIDDRSRLIPLNPFVDNQGILRVGGRLVHSDLSYDQKHPILLPSNHYITRLIIREEHLRLKHAGAQATLYSIRENYWPLDGRNVTRQIIHKCVPCFRVKPRGINYMMGDLPQVRTSQSLRPFLNVGVDYCGPLYIKEKRFQNRKKIKVYVAIYVCMGTKAVHLELVSDMTTEAFIASLKRFFSRRGKSKSIYSDNGKNFVGANRELNDLYQLLLSAEHNKNVQQFLMSERITWHFIPPGAPHFGGLWEAAVKSFKHHLLRTVGDTLLTYEQLETCIIEIEAVLNSRPISPMSSDPNDLRPLTPGHILVGGPLTSLSQMNLSDTPSNRLSSWEHVQKMREHFWKRWSKEYLNQLIVRSKWPLNFSHCIKVGSMVMIKEDEITPPLQWTVGRIIAVQPGEDGVIRSATVKTVKGEFKRGAKKLFPLPIESPVCNNA